MAGSRFYQLKRIFIWIPEAKLWISKFSYIYIHKDISKGNLWRDFFEGHVWILGKNSLHYCFFIQHLRCFQLLFMSLLFFSVRTMEELVGQQIACHFCNQVTLKYLMSILWTIYFNILMVKLCTQLSTTLRTSKKSESNREGNSRENFKTARNWRIFIINITD